jgi:hypothetical protein
LTDFDSPLDAIDLDKLAVAQALLDAEIANERARELTFRLIESSRTTAELREALDLAELRYAELEALQLEIKSSKAYRLAERVWKLIYAIRA